jgi:hypothetical protein
LIPADCFVDRSLGTHAAVASVKHITSHRLLSALIDEFKDDWLRDPDGVARYDRLLAICEREARSMSSLANRMRLAQASRYRGEMAEPPSKSSPWKVSVPGRRLPDAGRHDQS